MSRSYKHILHSKGENGRKWKDKQTANKKVRHYYIHQNGMFYKKIFETWLINDWHIIYYSLKDVKKRKYNYRDNKKYRLWMK